MDSKTVLVDLNCCRAAHLIPFLSQGILKAGVCARTDAHKVARDFGVTVEGVAELTDHPVVRAQEGLQSRSLASKSSNHTFQETHARREETHAAHMSVIFAWHNPSAFESHTDLTLSEEVRLVNFPFSFRYSIHSGCGFLELQSPYLPMKIVVTVQTWRSTTCRRDC